MRELGLDAFRFSIAWPRVLPDGTRPRQRGGARLLRPAGRRAARERDRAVRRRCTTGISRRRSRTPAAGPSARPPRRSSSYTEAVASRLGDRVTHWITHNEPWVASWLGYGWGVHAPGRTSDEDAVAAAHHLLLSHGWALPSAAPRRRRAPRSASRSTSTHAEPAELDAEADAEAARQVDGRPEPLVPRPALPRRVPGRPAVRAARAQPATSRRSRRRSTSSASTTTSASSPSREQRRRSLPMAHVPGATYTDMGWEVYPDGFHDVPRPRRPRLRARRRST